VTEIRRRGDLWTIPREEVVRSDKAGRTLARASAADFDRAAAGPDGVGNDVKVARGMCSLPKGVRSARRWPLKGSARTGLVRVQAHEGRWRRPTSYNIVSASPGGRARLCESRVWRPRRWEASLSSSFEGIGRCSSGLGRLNGPCGSTEFLVTLVTGDASRRYQRSLVCFGEHRP